MNISELDGGKLDQDSEKEWWVFLNINFSKGTGSLKINMEMKACSIMPLFPYGFVIIAAVSYWLVVIIIGVRRKRTRKIGSGNSVMQG